MASGAHVRADNFRLSRPKRACSVCAGLCVVCGVLYLFEIACVAVRASARRIQNEQQSSLHT